MRKRNQRISDMCIVEMYQKRIDEIHHPEMWPKAIELKLKYMIADLVSAYARAIMDGDIEVIKIFLSKKQTLNLSHSIIDDTIKNITDEEFLILTECGEEKRSKYKEIISLIKEEQ